MSDGEQGKREWRFYVQDMIEFSEKVLAYSNEEVVKVFRA